MVTTVRDAIIVKIIITSREAIEKNVLIAVKKKLTKPAENNENNDSNDNV